MQIRILSIEDVAAPGERTPELGRYRVVLEADGEARELAYTVRLSSSGERSLSWTPRDSILADHERVPVMVVGAVSDTVVRFHRGEPVELPMRVTPEPPGPDTVILEYRE